MNERASFTEALDRETPEDRAAYLDAACAGDPALRGRVETLLRSHEAAGEFPPGGDAFGAVAAGLGVHESRRSE